MIQQKSSDLFVQYLPLMGTWRFRPAPRSKKNLGEIRTRNWRYCLLLPNKEEKDLGENLERAIDQAAKIIEGK